MCQYLGRRTTDGQMDINAIAGGREEVAGHLPDPEPEADEVELELGEGVA